MEVFSGQEYVWKCSVYKCKCKICINCYAHITWPVAVLHTCEITSLYIIMYWILSYFDAYSCTEF